MRRVVVTGMGVVTPLGVGVSHVWRRLLNGDSGLGPMEGFDASDLACRIAGHVPTGDTGNGDFNVDDWVDRQRSAQDGPVHRIRDCSGGRGD